MDRSTKIIIGLTMIGIFLATFIFTGNPWYSGMAFWLAVIVIFVTAVISEMMDEKKENKPMFTEERWERINDSDFLEKSEIEEQIDNDFFERKIYGAMADD